MKPERTTAPVPCYRNRKGVSNGIEMDLDIDRLPTLDVIIESRVFVAIEIQVFECVVCGKVLMKHKSPCG